MTSPYLLLSLSLPLISFQLRLSQLSNSEPLFSRFSFLPPPPLFAPPICRNTHLIRAPKHTLTTLPTASPLPHVPHPRPPHLSLPPSASTQTSHAPSGRYRALCRLYSTIRCWHDCRLPATLLVWARSCAEDGVDELGNGRLGSIGVSSLPFPLPANLFYPPFPLRLFLCLHFHTTIKSLPASYV